MACSIRPSDAVAAMVLCREHRRRRPGRFVAQARRRRLMLLQLAAGQRAKVGRLVKARQPAKRLLAAVGVELRLRLWPPI